MKTALEVLRNRQALTLSRVFNLSSFSEAKKLDRFLDLSDPDEGIGPVEFEYSKPGKYLVHVDWEKSGEDPYVLIKWLGVAAISPDEFLKQSQALGNQVDEAAETMNSIDFREDMLGRVNAEHAYILAHSELVNFSVGWE